jgi:hypothetical protein
MKNRFAKILHGFCAAVDSLIPLFSIQDILFAPKVIDLFFSELFGAHQKGVISDRL